MGITSITIKTEWCNSQGNSVIRYWCSVSLFVSFVLIVCPLNSQHMLSVMMILLVWRLTLKQKLNEESWRASGRPRVDILRHLEMIRRKYGRQGLCTNMYGFVVRDGRGLPANQWSVRFQQWFLSIDTASRSRTRAGPHFGSQAGRNKFLLNSHLKRISVKIRYNIKLSHNKMLDNRAGTRNWQ